VPHQPPHRVRLGDIVARRLQQHLPHLKPVVRERVRGSVRGGAVGEERRAAGRYADSGGTRERWRVGELSAGRFELQDGVEGGRGKPGRREDVGATLAFEEEG
ncbi:MAG: hypothetical protein Q9206_007428, partial [Seirophora lacunosa]